MKTQYLSVCLIAAAFAVATTTHAEPAKPSKPPVPGTETGHGNGEGDDTGEPLRASRHPRKWCGDLKWMVKRVFRNAQGLDPASARQVLASDTQTIISSYEAGGMPYQPLTYQMLTTALKVNAQFPEGDALGDQAGGIVLSHMLGTAVEVNKLDAPQFYPVIEAWKSCRHYRCPSDAQAMSASFYTAYIQGSLMMLDMLFSNALPPDSKMQATVLGLMGKDRWQLMATNEIFKSVSESLKLDLYARYLECLIDHIDVVQMDLTNYLEGNPEHPVSDKRQRYNSEAYLNEIREDLQTITYGSDVATCTFRY